uniref:Laminin, beta 2-like n=1 Tax=Denticeps clupeoides TaxID=299321 RepID=A0AAY4DRU2_9TELE
SLSSSQRPGSCYPATGNLLIGRASSLTATSTCGLHGSEQYCIVSHLQDQDKCFECNSQRPYSSHHRNSHRVENVIYHTDKHGDPTWWQSVNGVCNVGIRLDLEAEFHFTHLIMKFKTFRPAAMLIERSVDFGRTWRPYRYFAYECSKTFPSISTHPLQFINDVICEERYSDIEPSTDGEVIYKVLDPALHIDDPYSIRTQELLRITNLRINFTKLHTLGDDQLDRRPEVLQKYYYSLYELVVRGSCFCYGHASECAPVPGVHGSEPGMIHGHCMCKHNTEGMNCERCKDFYHDLPWRPAESKHPHTCKECNCNGHTSQCHFDMAVYLATGNSSGGVCDNCLHNTMGRNCETCKPFYYKDTSRDIRDPAACVTCDCDPVGSVEGGVCDSHTDPELGMIAGQCRCKPNVRGARCDVCKEGHYGLSKNDPLGCQPCNCDPRGITTIGGPCDHVSGDCTCKRYVTGRYCNQCLPEYWGLSNDISGCRACGCDFGGAINNKCSVDSGQCDCRPHLIGRQCADVQPGYFCAPLDYYRYEAENPDVRPVHRERAPGQMITWTGPGFARVKDGSGLVFTIDNIPYSMEYDIMIRYEPEVHVLMSRPFCFEPGNHYVVAIRFQRHGVSHRHLTAFILVDSLVLLPKYEELRGFRGNSAVAEHRRDEMHRYTCVDSFLTTPMPALAEMCTKLICSISAIMHNGALPCHCDPQGSLSSECNHVGGQCQCKPNVIGRRCDQCAPGTYGFGPYGCNVCDCHSQGSLSHQCDPQTGQCPCRHGAMGRQCSDCHPGQWGFPSCRPCQCNGHSDSCDPQTGDCYQCRDNTAGQLCETCKNGYYGNPVLGSGEHCRPCPCPGNPGSGHSNGDSCYADYASNQILCNCRQGYTGDRCDRCAPGYYGDPRQPGSECRPCECNGNIDPQDPDACDPFSGQCLRCLYNTDGPSCSECKPGYYGNALSQDCKRCTCNIAGTRPEYCQDGVCHCDRQTGACPCKMNVIGHNCDECAPNHWNFGTDHGCEACSCYHPNALSTRCNMFSGQCPCHTGFGGKHCTECEPFHWGDPQVQCNGALCQCNTLGSESPQCDRVTGACICRNGASGRNCDECARGFTGTFPNCAECHACFQLWDDILCQVRTSFDRIRNIIGTILDKGVPPGVSDTRIRQLERKLSEIRELIRGGDHDAIHQHIKQFKNILKYYKESQNSERRCNASTSGPHSPVKQSHNTRKKTEALLKERLDHIRQEGLKAAVMTLIMTVEPLHPQVCGGHGNGSVNGSCPDSPCGGAGCRDDKNLRVCGGDQCNGTMSITREVLQKVNNITNNLTAVSEGLLGIEKMLRDITALMQDVKNQSLDTLKKAQKKKDFFEKNNSELKSFIKKIKDFLTEEGADPESIETVAQQVLDITLPVNKTMMDEVLQEIRNNIANLTNIEGVYNHTSQHLHQAKNLLNRAQQAKIRAEAVKDATTKTIEALEASEKAIEKAMNSVEMALANLNLTKEATILVEHKLSSLEAKQMEAMNRLMNLSETVVMLRNKTGANKLMALDAKLDADSATQSAAELEKVCVCKRFRNNDQRLQDQQAELAQMEQNVTDVKDIIRREAVQYSTCN